ncbi:SDR family oxidoreductase [Roseibaca sp. V10]|uniref:SDR family oxidoreductase n=1 Tax=Roseinatronobacter domitianus TaxID=2940293 RepID=A0ABT0LYZ5_9RHOB|nr:SDR family oxidoreductase [Roseibaca domitiana]MCL1627841.1 SDR family oxidoreductase [Roseibaca domitiana]
MAIDLSSLRGKSVLVTGASRGIGAEAVRAFVAAGARVGMIARDSGALQTLAQDTGALPIACDITDFAAVAQAVAQMQRQFGGLDVLVNNAGMIDPIAPLAQTDPEEFGRLIDINLKGVFHGMRAAMPVLPDGGTIITVGSGAAYNPLDGWGGYCSSKAGAWMLTRVAAKEAPHLRIMSLSPGTVATDMQRNIRASGINPVSQLEWSAHIPPDWPARALAWMCTPDADDWLGQEVSLRDEIIRKRLELTG